MPRLKFYDLKSKKSFESDEYEIVMKGNTKFAVTDAPSGIKSYRIVTKTFRR